MWPRIREILFGNLGLKLASVFLATLLYAHVVTDQPREQVIQIPVTTTGLPDTLAFRGRPPERVGVRIRGAWKDLIRLGLTSPYLAIDMAKAAPGPFSATISIEDVKERALPPELSKVVVVTEVLEPRTVSLTVERKASKRVFVRARVTGKPPIGYRLQGRPKAIPDSALVEGPASVIDSLESLDTLPVDIAQERERIQRQVEIDPGPVSLRIEPRRVVVSARLVKAEADTAAAPR
jgi:YbbR domain-containing protein